ncbi:nicotinate (nicotinamide) nucleotide adenylyltransferase [Spirochaeta lutea]|uniref:Probable nicotinate-nucleotide adenylyltransferase n=1 Tax=Spirochaeta lutea TaxID=1480694 RepID=A0A098R556_9SPIO|nr:nicotinate (nicotinamide) nucleotide adenylyltransferase [Spirochaeta lutea]KGE73857.1 hypothetical protein DC28_01215 [Spirochaeta lutea]
MVRYALLGGSFDPVHIGHLFIADTVLHGVGPESVIFMPAQVSPHKQDHNPVEARHRLEMLTLATRGNRRFVVSDSELRRGGLSYTYDTVVALMAELGCSPGEIGLVVGYDLVKGLPTWYRAGELFSLVRLIVLRRPGIIYTKEDEENLLGGFIRDPDWIIPLENPGLEISSSMIRRAIRRDEPYRYLLPEDVYDYIRENSLYSV